MLPASGADLDAAAGRHQVFLWKVNSEGTTVWVKRHGASDAGVSAGAGEAVAVQAPGVIVGRAPTNKKKTRVV